MSDASIYGGGTLGLHVVSALLTPIVAMLLGPAELGVWAVALSVFAGLSQVYTLGLQAAVVRFYSVLNQRPAEQVRFVGSVSSFVLLWGAMASVVLLAVGPDLFSDVSPSLKFWPHGMFLVLMCLLSSACLVPQALWQAQRKPLSYVTAELVAAVVFVLVTLTLASITSLGVLSLFWGRLLSMAVLGAALLYYAARQFGFDWYGPSLVSALRFGLPIAAGLLSFWLLGMADRLVIERQLGIAEVGVYATAAMSCDVIRLLAVSGARALQPLFYRAEDEALDERDVARGVSYFVAFVACAAAALFVLAPTMIRLLFPPEYHYAAKLTPILAVVGGLHCMYAIDSTALSLARRSGLVALFTLMAGALTVLLNVWLLPRVGLAGAAWAALAGHVALALALRVYSSRYVQVPFEGGRLGRLLGVLSGFALSGWLVDGLFPATAELFVKVLLFGVTFLVLTRTFLSREELEALRVRLGLSPE